MNNRDISKPTLTKSEYDQLVADETKANERLIAAEEALKKAEAAIRKRYPQYFADKEIYDKQQSKRKKTREKYMRQICRLESFLPDETGSRRQKTKSSEQEQYEKVCAQNTKISNEIEKARRDWRAKYPTTDFEDYYDALSEYRAAEAAYAVARNFAESYRAQMRERGLL